MSSNSISSSSAILFTSKTLGSYVSTATTAASYHNTKRRRSVQSFLVAVEFVPAGRVHHANFEFVSDETCGICRMAIDGSCRGCKLPGDNCTLDWGACNHAFHLHCVLRWANSQTSQDHCPVCRREWQFKE